MMLIYVCFTLFFVYIQYMYKPKIIVFYLKNVLIIIYDNNIKYINSYKNKYFLII